MSTIDLPRFKEALDMLRRHNIKVGVLLDLGCGDGGLTVEVAKVVGASEVYCADVDVNALSVASSRGLKPSQLTSQEIKYLSQMAALT
jgi:predicted RNA methylase